MESEKTVTKKPDAKVKPVRRFPDSTTQSAELATRENTLREQVKSLEEKASYAEREAELREQIREAKARIKASRPKSVLAEAWNRLPKGVRVLLVVVVVIVAVLLYVKLK